MKYEGVEKEIANIIKRIEITFEIGITEDKNRILVAT